MKASKNARRQAMDLFRLCRTNGTLDEKLVRQIVQQIVTTKPRDYLGTLSHFKRLVQLEKARHMATVESAQALPADLRSRVEKELGRAYGAGLSTSFEDNPSLIGGMRIRVGSDVYDGSVRGRLEMLEQCF